MGRLCRRRKFKLIGCGWICIRGIFDWRQEERSHLSIPVGSMGCIAQSMNTGRQASNGKAFGEKLDINVS
jgi:hypothetical protein